MVHSSQFALGNSTASLGELAGSISAVRFLIRNLLENYWYAAKSSSLSLQSRKSRALQTTLIRFRNGHPRDSDEDTNLNESDCKDYEESADVIDNIPVNPDIYISLGMAQNGYRLIVMFLANFRLEMFCDKAVVQQAPRT
ncbi:hypothetical protein TNCV_1446241 [Trichonephila clavipes]|nr:hypothetical protein TNCV_1446241 [Trichonephila clavipes]